jgi:hypothetical protein
VAEEQRVHVAAQEVGHGLGGAVDDRLAAEVDAGGETTGIPVRAANRLISRW